MAVSERAHTVGFDSSGGTSFSLTKPAGTTGGDLIVIGTAQDSDGVEASTPTAPSGFLQLGTTGVESGISPSIKFFWRAADGTEGSSFTLGIDSNSSTVGFCSALIGADTNNPLRNTPVFGVGTATGVTAPLVGDGTTLVGDLEMCLFAAQGSGTFAFTTPTLMTEIMDQDTGWVSAAADILVITTAGAQAAKSSTRSGGTLSGNWRSASLIIAQAPPVVYKKGLLLPY